MILKVDYCTLAVQNGVKQTSIQKGTLKYSILIELLSDEGSETK